MIVSHGLGFAFIKTNKATGTSLEVELSRFCGPADIITRLCIRRTRRFAARSAIAARRTTCLPGGSTGPATWRD